MQIRIRRASRLLDRRGVALPLALVGLVVVSLLVTAALLTSSTELAISGAHQDATRALYASEAGIEGYVARLDSAFTAGNLTPPAIPSPFNVPGGGQVQITMTRLQNLPSAGGVAGREVYCITSTPVGNASRKVGAMLEVTLTPNNLNLNINGAGSFGGAVEVRGNATISGQQQNAALCSDQSQVPAIETSKEGSFKVQGGSATLIGGTNTTTETKVQFQNRILGGYTPSQIANLAQIKFGTRFGKPAFAGKPNSEVNAKGTPLNWGCPGTMLAGTSRPCLSSVASMDTTYYPTVAIDANGGTVDIQGDHGQGILVVVNGNLKISGNFRYKGIIIVEGALDVTGTVNVTGAVIGLSTITVGKTANDATSELGGTLNITYDPCVNRKAVQSFNSAAAVPRVAGPAYAWFEVVR